jgi:arylsulfatase A-like enzyme
MSIADEDWDHLIVLDACRYDVFKEVYQDYFDGELSKRESPGCRTPDWFKAEFDGKNFGDIVYISSNPHINSKAESKGIKASENFHKVIDVWFDGWNEKKMTVPPQEVRDAAIKANSDYSDKRMIIHFIQPHYPYLDKKIEGLNWVKGEEKDSEITFKERVIRKAERELLGDRLSKLIGRTNTWRVREKLRARCRDGQDEKVWRELHNDMDEWHRLYEDNLRRALEQVKDLIEQLDGKIVVTADHGEALGEEDVFVHPPNTDVDVLKEVPWLEVEK